MAGKADPPKKNKVLPLPVPVPIIVVPPETSRTTEAPTIQIIEPGTPPAAIVTPVFQITEDPDIQTAAPASPKTLNGTTMKAPEIPMPKAKSAMKSPGKPAKALLGADLAFATGPDVTLKREVAENDRGRPMMEWIRRQSMYINKDNIKDFSMRDIGVEELSSHNTQESCWMALRGQVYDVTGYVKFHPGGVTEIMKGAGKDATALFNSIHRYVNFETILKGRRIGMYTPGKDGSSIDSEAASDLALVNTREEERHLNQKKCWGCRICRFCKLLDDDDELLPYTNFKEDDRFLIYQVELRGHKFGEEYWTVGILRKEELLLKVVTKPPELWIAHYKLKEALANDSLDITFYNRARKVIVKLEKPREWGSIGHALEHCNVIEDSRQTIDDMYRGAMLSRKKIAHNMYLISLQIHPAAHIGVPVGFDVKITIDGVSRRYTPISLPFHNEFETAANKPFPNWQVLWFMIKVYEDGQLTPLIRDLPLRVEDSLQIGSIRGSFNTDFLMGGDAYFLMAAGSGITPHIRIIKHFIDHNVAIGVSHVVLVHWVKEERELVWRGSFEKMTQEKDWFNYVPVLTQCGDDSVWKGCRGRISTHLFLRILQRVRIESSRKRRVRFITCGTDGFNCAVCETIEALEYPLNSTFIFQG